MRVSLYATVSIEGQDPEVQLSALRAHAANQGWEIVEEWVDKGFWDVKERPPGLKQLMESALAGRCQAVLVWQIDRLAQSVQQLITILEALRNLKIHIISLQEQLDTGSPTGQAILTFIGAMARLEKDHFRDKVKAGLARARAKGLRLGRPKAQVRLDQIVTLQRQGLSLHEIARQLGCSRATLRRRLKEGKA